MEKDFDLQNYTLYDVLHLLQLPYEFHTPHLAETKKKINLLNQPSVDGSIYNFYKKTFIIVNCINKYREKKMEFDIDYFPDVEEDKRLYDEIILIPEFDKLESPERVLEHVLHNNENLRIKSNNEQPREIIQEFMKKLERSKKEPNLSTPVPLAPGSVNAIKRQLQVRNLYMHSSYRNEINTHSTSTNFDYFIPNEINNVVSMELTSLNIPENSWYHINNLTFTVGDNTVSTHGNYTREELITVINTQLDNTNVSIEMDDYTGKVKITNSNGISIDIIFSTDEKLKKKSLGWILGFREMSYTISSSASIEAEGIIDIGTNRFLYFCVNDYQNNVNEMNSLCVANNLSNNHILGKITFPSASATATNTTFKSTYSAKRNYNGPINLKRLHIELIDKDGEIIDLNNMDFGFSLQLEVLYERDLIV